MWARYVSIVINYNRFSILRGHIQIWWKYGPKEEALCGIRAQKVLIFIAGHLNRTAFPQQIPTLKR